MPGCAIRLAGTAAVSWVVLTTVEVRETPFISATAPVRKPLPVTVRVKAGPPAVTLDGEMPVMAGNGGVTFRGSGLDAGLPGFAAVTGTGPTCRIRLAGTAAVSCVALTNVVVNEVFASDTVAPDTKPAPFTVKMNAGPPAAIEDGEILVMAGGAGAMVRLTALDAVPPAFAAVIWAVPACAIRLAGTTAVTCVELTKVVKAVLLKKIVAPARKLVPETVKVKAGPPAVTVNGEMPVIAGVGGAIVRLTALEAAPPVFCTVIWAVPAAATKLAGTAAVSWAALTKVVVKAVLLNDTVAPARKPVPVTVKVKAGPPEATVDGEMPVTTGVWTAIVRLTALDAVPPVFVTVIGAVPGRAIRLAGTAAVSWVALTKVVLKAVPFNDTAAPEKKPVPLTVNVSAALPALTVAGEMLMMTGSGSAIVKVTALEAGPDGFARVICADPG